MTEGYSALASIAVALIASAVCMLVAGRFRPRRLAGQGRPKGQGDRTGLAAVVVGAVSGYAVLALWPRWPPANALDRFLVIVLPATVALLTLGHWPRKSRALRWGLEFVLAVVLVRILLHASVYLQEGAREVGILLLGSAGILVGVLSLVQKLWIRQRHNGDNDGGGQASQLLALAAALFAAGLLIAMAGYIKGGSAALPWSAAIAGATIGSRLGSQDADLRGIVSLSVVLLFGFLFIGRFFGELTTGTALLVLLAPLLCWTSQLPWLRRCAPMTRDLLGLALVAVSLFVILLWAKQTFDREMAPLISQVTSNTTLARSPSLGPRKLSNATVPRISIEVAWFGIDAGIARRFEKRVQRLAVFGKRFDMVGRLGKIFETGRVASDVEELLGGAFRNGALKILRNRRFVAMLDQVRERRARVNVVIRAVHRTG